MYNFNKLSLTVAALSLLASSTTDAQTASSGSGPSYPARPLRMVVGAATGGTPDILGRIIGQKLTEQLGQPVIVDNRPGATGNIGADVVAKAAPDGHTMIMATSVLSISPAFYRSLPFDPLTGLAPVSQLVSQLMFLGLSPALGQIKAGRLRVLAVASGKRSATAPEVPTFAEAGVPGVVMDNWLGVLTTGGTPKPVIDKLHAELMKALRAPDSAERLAQQHLEITASSPAEFAAFFKAEIAKVAKVVRAAGIEPQ